MFGNNRELPPGFITRRIRNSDISDVLKFLQNEYSTQRDYSSKQVISLIIILIALALRLIYLWLINGSSIIIFFYIFLALFIPFLILCPIIWVMRYFHWSDMIQSGKCLLMRHQNEIRAVIITSKFNNYSYIGLLIVSNSYRRRGLGTYLISRVKQNLNYPIYLFCLPEPGLVEFYNSNGFVAIEENQLPRRISKTIGKTTISPLIPMILEENLEYE